ncbi:type-F conjugative transfer system protein TraW [Hydromonas duriensis]|uniref:Conjugal transfer pilus assembly protein TraW n=1 Tax=Hydromonas duriensis TaxID=1527608 RepID=A0A4V3DJL0_9BURK|nr:type-F conjugative transfer system protein TraW [Hydromonas duriensis]TDR30291.1 conjugal transfer pilus assembly protein TraW [Hydromonas duriensis]
MNHRTRHFIQYSALALAVTAGVWSLAQAQSIEPATAAPALATDLMGRTYPITETDALVAIQNRLNALQQSGELERMSNQIKANIEGHILEPQPIEGIVTVTQNAVRYFDPTWVLPEDLYDDAGHVMAAKGTKVNPLDVMPVHKKLFFFDGRDRAQVDMAKKLAVQYGADFTPILTAGSWVDLSNEMQQAVYFDQMGKMTQRMSITAVPALVAQEGKLMRIEEIKP